MGGGETRDEDTVLPSMTMLALVFLRRPCPVGGLLVAYRAVKGITTTSTIKTGAVPGSSASHPLTSPVLVWAVPVFLVGISEPNKERAVAELVEY